MKTWKKISGKKIYSSPYFIVFEDKVLGPDGKQRKYSYIKPRTGVMVVPFDGKNIYMVKQFRYAIGKASWEFPAGGAENSNLLFQAKKELKEETGISAKKWKFLGEFNPGPSSSTGVGNIFLAQDLHFGESKLESTEKDLIVKKFTLAQVKKMVLTGEITSGWTLVSLLLFQLKFKKSL